jgi:hypothetical protein
VAYDAESDPTPAVVDAPGVAYTASDYAPGLRLFQCEPYRATLSTKACADRWRIAEDASTPSAGRGRRDALSNYQREDLVARYRHCRGCPLGAAHAGRQIVRYSAWYGRGICPRCGQGATRIIGNRRCVSCYNRERELKAGRNARGNIPVELLERPLRTIEVLVDVDGEVRRHRDPASCSLTETVVQELRTTKGEITFARAAGALVVVGEEPPGRDVPTAAIETDANTLWAFTDTRCLTCSGRIMQGAAGVLECADCGRVGEGRPDAEHEWSVSRAEQRDHGVGDHAPAEVRRGIDPLRARLFASTALAPVPSLIGAIAVAP